MDIKARLTQVRTWVWVGIVTVLGTVAKYSIENSKLPDWLSNLVDLVGLHFLPSVEAVFDVRLPVVVFLIVGVFIAIAGCWIVRYYRGQLSVVNEKLCQLESENANLRGLESARKDSVKSSDKPRLVLDRSAPGYKEFDQALQAKMAEMAPFIHPGKLDASVLTKEQLSVFEFVCDRLDSGLQATKKTVMRELHISLLTAEDILDNLCDQGFLAKPFVVSGPEWYSLPPAGRSCYLELKKGVTTAPTRHG
ncbi:hypothetical protein [Pseudomonas putida]